MNVTEAKVRYLEAARYFAPDYGGDHEVLASFRDLNPTLSDVHAFELIDILSGNEKEPKYFVADLLYYYASAPEALLQPMLRAAIELNDASFNRIFLRPSLTIYGDQAVLSILIEWFRMGDVVTRIRVSGLTYWLMVYGVNIAVLYALVKQVAQATNNPIELYYYMLAFPRLVHKLPGVQGGAASLQQQVDGNVQYEELLYGKLGWKKLE
jgi:hypothetical protein